MTIKRIIEEELNEKVFVVVWWTYDDVIQAAERQGVNLTKEELDAICEENSKWFGESYIDSGLETLNYWD